MPLPLHTSNGENDDPASREAGRFETFYQDILELQEVLERVENFTVRRRMREIISRLEELGFLYLADLFSQSCFVTFRPPASSYFPFILNLKGLAGGSLSGKSSLVHRYLAGYCPKDELLSGRHKKCLNIDGKKYLLLVRDETGPPDSQFSKWLDAILLVFSYADELSFNVLSSYYAKMEMYRNVSLPVILVGIKSSLSVDEPSMIDDVRIRKFIQDHGNCPFFHACLETGAGIRDIFESASEVIIKAKSNPNVQNSGFDINSSPAPYNLVASSIDALSSSNYGSSLSIASQGSVKKQKRKSVFSKADKKEDIPDDFGSGRMIPTKQGYLYKRSHNSLKEWKKKYVTICDNNTLVYYANMKDYIEEINGKKINLAHTTVKVPGRRPPKLSSQSASKQLTTEFTNTEPSKKQQQPSSKQNSVLKEPVDAVVISNSLAAGTSKETNDNSISIDNAIAKTSKGIISTGIHGTPSVLSPTKKKNRRHGGRHAKSCEIDYGQVCSDADNPQGTPSSARKRFTHKRNKSGAGKELQFDKGTDTEDDDVVFTVISLDGKSWDFEATTPDERDRWIDAIEQQILKAFQNGLEGSTKQERCPSDSSGQSGTSVKSSLRSIAGNDRCADCGSSDPEWASINLGILICIECSGVHRNLGTHLSKVRSLDLDDWPPECLMIMSIIGNEYANTLWEHSCKGRRKPQPDSTREMREEWIDLKYRKKEFLEPLPNCGVSVGQQLLEAVVKDDRKLCYVLLIHSTAEDVNIRTKDSKNLTSLHISCKLGNVVVTQLILWYFGDPRALDARGHTPMTYAHESKSRECAELLTQFGCPEDTPC